MVLVKSNLIVTYVISFAAGVSIAAAFLLPWWVLGYEMTMETDQ